MFLEFTEADNINNFDVAHVCLNQFLIMFPKTYF